MACCRGRSRRCRLFLGGNEYDTDRGAPSDFYLLEKGDTPTQESHRTTEAAHRAGHSQARAKRATNPATDTPDPTS